MNEKFSTSGLTTPGFYQEAKIIETTTITPRTTANKG